MKWSGPVDRWTGGPSVYKVHIPNSPSPTHLAAASQYIPDIPRIPASIRPRHAPHITTVQGVTDHTINPRQFMSTTHFKMRFKCDFKGVS